MDVKQMTYILTIAQEGGISKAAAKLFITQSALDQQLLKLEHELGTRLFFRSRSSFALTEAGRVYVEYARRMLELKNEAYRIIHDIAGRRRGTLSLAFAPERGMEMFMAVYPRFYQSYPEVTVTPREISVRRQLEMLAGDELDLGFISRPEGEVPGLTCVPLLREEFLLITPRSHPLAARATTFRGWRTWPASACLPIPPGPCLPATGAIATCPNPPSISSPWPPPISVPSAPRKKRSCRNEPHL